MWRAEGFLRKDQQYVLPLKRNPLGPNEALAVDHLTCHHRSAAGFLVSAVSKTPNVSRAFASAACRACLRHS